jgi:hypothetical protein
VNNAAGTTKDINNRGINSTKTWMLTSSLSLLLPAKEQEKAGFLGGLYSAK